MVSLLKDRKRKLEILEEAIMEKDLTAQALPSGWPVRSGYITSNYGMRVHPTKRRRIFHEGVDFAAPRGTPIVAVADGVVVFSGKRGEFQKAVGAVKAAGEFRRFDPVGAGRIDLFRGRVEKFGDKFPRAFDRARRSVS